MSGATPASDAVHTIRIDGIALPRSHPLPWGQQAILTSMDELGASVGYFNLKRIVPVPEGTPLSEVIAALRATLRRHEGLRSTFTRNENGPTQHVAPSAELEVGLVHAAAPTRSSVEEMARRLSAKPFDHAVELPLRCLVVLVDGYPRWLVLAVSHLAADAQAMHVLVHDLRAFLVHDQRLDEDCWQPREQVAYERSTPALMASERAIERWAAAVGSLDRPPADGEIESVPRSAERFVELSLDSIPARAAAERIAARRHVSVSSVVLAVICLCVGHLDGRERATITLISGNRTRRRERGYVGPLAQDALFDLSWKPGELTDFDVFCGAVHRAALAAYSSARYDPVRLRAVLGERDLLGRAAPRTSTFFNDARPGPMLPADTTSVRPATTRGGPHRTGAWPHLELRRFFVLQQIEDAYRLRAIVDTAAVTENTAACLLDATVDVLRTGAGRPVALADLAGLLPPRPLRSAR